MIVRNLAQAPEKPRYETDTVDWSGPCVGSRRPRETRGLLLLALALVCPSLHWPLFPPCLLVAHLACASLSLIFGHLSLYLYVHFSFVVLGFWRLSFGSLGLFWFLLVSLWTLLACLVLLWGSFGAVLGSFVAPLRLSGALLGLS